MKKLLLFAAGLALTGAVNAQIFSEDFEGGAIPAGWGDSSLNPTGGWDVGTSGSMGSTYFPLTGNATYFAGTNDDGCNACDKSDDFLWTTDVDLTTYAGQTLHLSYLQYYFDGSYQGAQEEAFIKYSTDGGTTWTDLYQLPGANGWAQNIIDVSAIAGMNVKLGFHYNDGGGWTYGCAIDDLSLYVAPTEDVTLTSLDMPNYLKLNTTSVDVMGNVFNAAGTAITSLDVEYTVNGGAPVTGSITGLNIPPLSAGTFTHPTAWTPTAAGDFNIEVTITGINGSIDADIADNVDDHDITVYTTSYDRTVLYETFTSSTCGPCVAGNANFESVISNIPAAEFASIKYQMSWPGNGDPYNAADGNARRSYYGINSVPAMQVDGGWNGNSGAFTQAVHDAAMEVPAFVKLTSKYHIDVAGQKVSTCTTIEALQNLGDATLQVSIKEFETDNNVGSNGETLFKDVVKKLAPNPNGQTITITSGMSQEVCVDYTFQGSYRLPNNAQDLIDDATEHSVEEFEDLGVVVWLQDDANMVVLNATNSVESQNPLSVADVATTSGLMLFPNPAQGNVTVNYTANEAAQAVITVYDMAGRTVKVMNHGMINGLNQITVDTEAFNNGVYFVEISSNNQVVTERLVIQK